ncbi:MAG: M20/M25/M40 family metallo-hydrolase [Oscillospiraceae bacterium]|nr:M20/M25/M40 family metallo-hydrolase [Oscillospiraceae bacterium]
MTPAIHPERLSADFLALAAASSESLNERCIADLLTEKLHELGFSVYEDNAGALLGGNAGNLYGYLAGALSGAPLLLSAHMDTVRPGHNKRPILHEDGTFTSDRTTVLGADDCAGIAEILEGIRSVQESGIPHRSIEVLFPVAEEIYIQGSGVFDFRRIQAKEAYVLDMSGPVGSAAVRAPSLISFRVTVTGRASHAGFAPENGIHAIKAAAIAIAKLPQGQIDPETTANIGTITGGAEKNIVPEQCICTGEVRSFSHARALQHIDEIRQAFSEAASACGAVSEMETREILRAYDVPAEAPVVQRFVRVCKQMGLPAELRRTFGGSDNHNFLKAGISGIVLSCGMNRVHSTDESVTLPELEQGASLVAGLIADCPHD